MILRDGLYQVIYGSICAGFVIQKGCLTDCAPVLKRKIKFWMTIAERINV